MSGALYIGTAGWDYVDWKGVVYPERPARDFDPLRRLASWFSAVELNVTFYRYVGVRTSASWVERVAAYPDFLFTAKLHQDFTHSRSWSRDDAGRFREGVAPLRESGRLGSLLLQFPWSFERSRENASYLADLLEEFGDFPTAVELRHASWDLDETRELLHRMQAGFCCVDMPVSRAGMPRGAHVTSSLAYLRLHGRNATTWFDRDAGRDARYDYLYARDELEEVAKQVRTMQSAAGTTFVIGNNHFRGQAVAAALSLKGILLGLRSEVPASLLRAYPGLSEWTDPAPSHGQRNLFP